MDEPKQSIWKKEISFGRKPKAAAKEPTTPTSASEEPKPSLWKKEISLKRKPKAAPVPAQPDTPEPPAAAVPEPAAAPALPPPDPQLGDLEWLTAGPDPPPAAPAPPAGGPPGPQSPAPPPRGRPHEPEALATALRTFFKKHKLPKRGVRLGIANNRIGVRIFDITGIDDPKQLGNAIRFRAQEALPIPIEDAVLDYQVLGETVDDEGQRTTRVLLVVAYRELIDRYVSACRKAGITLVAIDLEAFALLRSLAAPPEDTAAPANAALVAVAVGHERSTFAVSDGRVCEFTRVLDWGGGALNAAIARDLDLTPADAAPIKRALSLGPAAAEA